MLMHKIHVFMSNSFNMCRCWTPFDVNIGFYAVRIGNLSKSCMSQGFCNSNYSILSCLFYIFLEYIYVNLEFLDANIIF